PGGGRALREYAAAQPSVLPWRAPVVGALVVGSRVGWFHTGAPILLCHQSLNSALSSCPAPAAKMMATPRTQQPHGMKLAEMKKAAVVGRRRLPGSWRTCTSCGYWTTATFSGSENCWATRINR
uniref:Uncharacterized protein n=2 Tax=Aegilops tauschii subsp. strangulata TaxID=200361 RepID=A0A453CBK8_AEGTS